MDISKSILSRNQSQWLKGVLILLIVLGHNGILMGKYEGMQKIALNDFMYSFHVYAFFFITSLYNWKPISWEGIKKNFRKLYVPYTLMFCAVCLINTLMTRCLPDPASLFVGYFTGGDPTIDKAIGMSFVWFLPTMFSFLILLGVLARQKYQHIKYAIVIIGVVILAMSIIGKWSYTNESWAISGSWVALRVLPLCLICRYLLEKFNGIRWYQILVYCGALVSMVLFFKFFADGCKHLSYLRYGVVPFFMFQALTFIAYHMKHFYKSILYLGQHSLDIYLIHILVYNALVIMLKALHVNPGYIVGIVILILTLLLTFIFNYLFGKICPKGYRLLYSKEWPN